MKALFLTLIISLTATASYKADFISKTGLQEGVYDLTDGPQTCQSGTLKFVEKDEDLTLMLGAKALVTGLVKKEIKEKERDCLFTIKTTVTDKKISSTQIEKCNKLENKYTLEITSNNGSFEYKRIIFQKNKILREEVCKLKLAN